MLQQTPTGTNDPNSENFPEIHSDMEASQGVSQIQRGRGLNLPDRAHSSIFVRQLRAKSDREIFLNHEVDIRTKKVIDGPG
jgi:hypothetical protein